MIERLHAFAKYPLPQNVAADIRDNKLITTTGPGMATGGVYDGVQGLVQSAYNFGDWQGAGITSRYCCSNAADPPLRPLLAHPALLREMFA